MGYIIKSTLYYKRKRFNYEKVMAISDFSDIYIDCEPFQPLENSRERIECYSGMPQSTKINGFSRLYRKMEQFLLHDGEIFENQGFNEHLH